MRCEMSAEDIIHAGRMQATRAAWEAARAFAQALYGQRAARLTYSQTTVPEGDHRLRTIQALAFDAAGKLLPYDFSAPWWNTHKLPDYILASAQELTEDDLAHGLGGGFPDDLRNVLRAFAEECLGVETLHTWETGQSRQRWRTGRDEGESDTLTWMFDLTTPPSLPYVEISDDSGKALSTDDVIAAGVEREAYQRWAGVHEYVRLLYGERAAKADVSLFSRYNDFTYDRDIRLDVFDAAGQRLFYDLRLPWWQRFAFNERNIAKYEKEHDPTEKPSVEYDDARSYEVDERAHGEIARLATVLLGADFIATRTPWDTDTTSYDLLQPPPLRFSRLWTEGSEWVG